MVVVAGADDRAAESRKRVKARIDELEKRIEIMEEWLRNQN